jgi:O-antigen ligase
MRRLQARIFGSLFALYVLVGRWDLARVAAADASDSPVYLQLRSWIVLLMSFAFVSRAVSSNRRRPVRLARVLVPLSICLLYLVGTAAWSPNAQLAAAKAFDVALVGVATLALAQMLRRRDPTEMLWAFWGTILAIGCLLALIAVATVTSGLAGTRVAVLGGGPNIFARMMGYFAIACLFFWRKKGLTLLFLPAATLAFLLVLLSGSRGGFVALAVALALFVSLEVRTLARLAPLVAAVVVFSWAAVSFTELGQNAMESYDVRVRQLLFEERYTAGRDELFRSALQLGRSAPLVGGGLAAFPALELGVYPHNIFLEVFAEAGVVGLLLLFVVFLFGSIELWRMGPQLGGAAMAALTLALVASQFSGDFYDSRGVFAFLVMALYDWRGMGPVAGPARRVPVRSLPA